MARASFTACTSAGGRLGVVRAAEKDRQKASMAWSTCWMKSAVRFAPVMELMALHSGTVGTSVAMTSHSGVTYVGAAAGAAAAAAAAAGAGTTPAGAATAAGITGIRGLESGRGAPGAGGRNAGGGPGS